MKIGIFSECFKPTTNGVVVSVETFRHELEHFGWEYYIFTSGTRGYNESDPTHIFRYPSTTWIGPNDYPLSLPLLAPRTTQKIKHIHLDIIHTQHMFMMGGLGLTMGQKLKIPVVHTYHTLIADYTHYFGFLTKIVRKYIVYKSRNYCNACQAVVTPSESMKRILLTYGISTPIKVIPTGINLNEFVNPLSRDEIAQRWPKAATNKKLLLYLSRIANEKNLDFLFRVINQVKQKRNDFHLLMVGGGPEFEHYQNVVKNMDLDNEVTFAGMIKKEDSVNRIFGAADLFVFPSITETQGIVVVEAMAAGVPVVAVNKMGPSDIITNNKDGFLTDLNEDEFSDRINDLLDNQQLRERIIAEGKKTAQNYSSQNCGQKMKELYERTIQEYNRNRTQ